MSNYIYMRDIVSIINNSNILISESKSGSGLGLSSKYYNTVIMESENPVYRIGEAVESWGSYSSNPVQSFIFLMETFNKAYQTKKLSDEDCNYLTKKFIKSYIESNMIKYDDFIDVTKFVKDRHLNENVNKFMDSLKAESYLYKKINIILNNSIKLENVLYEENIPNSAINFLYNINDESYKDYIYEMCKRVDTKYKNAPTIKVFGVCLENILYDFTKRGVCVDNKSLLESISEYFLNTYRDDMIFLKEMKSGIENTIFYKDSEKIDILKEMDLYLNINKDEKDEIQPVGEFAFILEKKSIKNRKEKKNEDIKDIVKKEFRDLPNNSKVNVVMNKLYQKPVENVVDETPFILGWVRRFFLIGGTFAINPVLGVLVGLTDFFIDKRINETQSKKIIKTLEREKKNIEIRIKKEKNKDKKEDLIKYAKELDKRIEKMTNHMNSQVSDKKRYGDLYEAVCMMETQIEVLDTLEKIGIIEGDLKQVTQIQKEKLVKGANKMSSKEKAASKKIDNDFRGILKSIEKALTSDNRERVIRGEILPPASKIIKSAILVGGTWAINPAITIIGALGHFAINKKCKEREKQMILDELEVNLKICERELRRAEDNNDDKAYKDLLRTQKALETEKARIKYGIKVYSDPDKGLASTKN